METALSLHTFTSMVAQYADEFSGLHICYPYQTGTSTVRVPQSRLQKHRESCLEGVTRSFEGFRGLAAAFGDVPLPCDMATTVVV